MRTLIWLVAMVFVASLALPASAQMMHGRSHMQNKPMTCGMMTGKEMSKMCPCMSMGSHHKKQGT